ncbi:MAG: exodeoxyribonuclease III [Bacilli bacterium]|nr:exodeoxyribonuclease III [Bacilli bacterium]
MRFVSWNVNGIRACINKGFNEFFEKVDADIFAVQETKMQEGQADIDKLGYFRYMNSALKKGYSGTLVYTKNKPIDVKYGLENGKYNDEGRVITLEFDTFYFVTAYVPNSQEALARLAYRMEFEDDMRRYLLSLNKPVVYCGDLNVAHNPIDLRNPKSNEQNPGYSIEERTKFSELLNSGFVDTFRYLYPDKVSYSWWSYRFFAREKNIGWRIDYFVTSNCLKNQIKEAGIFDAVLGSDHAPVFLEIEI